jgi:hypothetical protein
LVRCSSTKSLIGFGSSGVGNLLVRGMSISSEPAGLLQHLSAAVGKYKLPHALAQLVDLLAVETGLGEFFIERRRLGLVEHVYRLDNSQQALSLEIHSDKFDLRSRDPMRRVVVKRNALLQGQALRLHVRLGNYDDTIGDRLVDMPADAAGVTVEANTHVTDVSIVAFDEAGERVDSVGGAGWFVWLLIPGSLIPAIVIRTFGVKQSRVVLEQVSAFMQGSNFGLGVLGTVDELPPPFAGSPSAPDLERRPRLHTTSFESPTAGDRSGTLDVLRKSTFAINRFLGERTFRGESKWFEAGASGQVEVIRWIKAKLESPTTAKAYLVDPFLGPAALTRVIARQGHENLNLTIVVSPGGIDPDADDPDARASGDHIGKLVAAAEEWTDRLCGSISIVHVQRGEGRRRAFHDRYLVLINNADVPQVFLLSNSLSRAAGIWPFAISEFDRPTAWEVRGYVEDLLEGKGDRQLVPKVVWQASLKSTAELMPRVAPEGSELQEPDWVEPLRRLIVILWRALGGMPGHREAVIAAIDAFIANWPTGIDITASGGALFAQFGHRPEVIGWLSSRLENRTAEQQELASYLDGELLRQFIGKLPPNELGASGYLQPQTDRDPYFQRLALAIIREINPTNYVRDKLNPAMHALVQTIELQRGNRPSGDSLSGAMCLINIGLRVAIASTKSEATQRIGLAVDYVHWYGRLTRSEIAATLLDSEYGRFPGLSDDVDSAAALVLKAGELFGEPIDAATSRLRDDQLIVSSVKAALVDSNKPSSSDAAVAIPSG